MYGPGPAELRDSLPVTGYTVDIRTAPDRNDELHCATLDQPLHYRPATDYQARRCPPPWLNHRSTYRIATTPSKGLAHNGHHRSSKSFGRHAVPIGGVKVVCSQWGHQCER